MKLSGKKQSIGLRFCILGLASLFIIVGAVFIFSGTTSAQDEVRGTFAPKNPEFLEYMEIMRTGGFWQSYSQEGYPLGDLPGPVDLNFTNIGTVSEADSLAKKFDLRTRNKLTTVKHQGSCGSCWAFATFGALESALMPIKAGRDSAVLPDFSEQHLITKHGFKWKKCAGGNIWLSMAYLTRWAGPVSEKSFPYKFMPMDGAPKVVNHVQNLRLIPTRSTYKDNRTLKKVVQKLGAIHVSMYYHGDCMNYATNAYYNQDKAEGGHAVLLVGWDDNFDRNKFNTPAPKNGAFIVRNSWGPNWGDAGFFYVSYYDEYFGRRSSSMAFQKPEAVTNYEEIYQYDPYGWVDSLGYSSNTAWFANIFTATSNTPIQAAGFYAVGSKNNYTVYVYTNVNNNAPRSGKLAVTKSGKSTFPGYFTVPLGKKVAVTKGQKFAVVVKLTTKGTNYPIPVEYFWKNYTKSVKGNKGESFTSRNGTTWEFATDYEAKMNVCLKAYAKK